MYIDLETKRTFEKLPDNIKTASGSISNPTLEQCVKAGLAIRKLDDSAVAAKGEVVTGKAYVQTADPLVAALVLTTRKEADILAEQAAAEKAAQDAIAERELARLAKRASITKAFPDEKQAAAIGELFDMHSRGPW